MEAWELEALEDGDEAEEEHALKASAATAVMANTVCEREKLMIIIIKRIDRLSKANSPCGPAHNKVGSKRKILMLLRFL